MTSPFKMVIHAPHLNVPIEPDPAAPQTVLPPREEASVIRKGLRLLVALHGWQRSGLKITPKPVRDLRQTACAGCGYYNPAGNFGFGECAAPGCGCTKFKIWLLSEKCPHPIGSRWPIV